MEQHPIPQQVSSYQFKLVGDMTLKQFFQVAGGVLVSLIIYSTPIIGIIKWPFVIVSTLLGVGLAFLPLEERPLERWIFAFFKAIYSPTIFNWQKMAATSKFFEDEPTATQTTQTQQDVVLKNYLATSNQVPASLKNLENAEKGFLQKISGLFSSVSPTPIPSSPTPVSQTPTSTPEIKIPQTYAVKIGPTGVPHLVVEEKPQEVTYKPELTAQQIAPTIAGNEMITTTQAIFSVDAAPPSPPTVPNVVVGQVVDQDRKIIDGAIMEIKDSSGRPIRAIRSNKAGHFITVTPLESGKYQILAEKDGYEFTAVSFEAVGNLIPPILVSGKMVIGEQEMEVGVNTTTQTTQ